MFQAFTLQRISVQTYQAGGLPNILHLTMTTTWMMMMMMVVVNQFPIILTTRHINPWLINQTPKHAGVLSGLALSVFSRPLTFLLGLIIFGAQWLASKGFNILPVDRLQRYVRHMNIRSALQDNAAFKLSFGLTFMLAAFASV
jgi:uncharacterized membrane protein (Fun14 family)